MLAGQGNTQVISIKAVLDKAALSDSKLSQAEIVRLREFFAALIDSIKKFPAEPGNKKTYRLPLPADKVDVYRRVFSADPKGFAEFVNYLQLSDVPGFLNKQAWLLGEHCFQLLPVLMRLPEKDFHHLLKSSLIIKNIESYIETRLIIQMISSPQKPKNGETSFDNSDRYFGLFLNMLKEERIRKVLDFPLRIFLDLLAKFDSNHDLENLIAQDPAFPKKLQLLLNVTSEKEKYLTIVETHPLLNARYKEYKAAHNNRRTLTKIFFPNWMSDRATLLKTQLHAKEAKVLQTTCKIITNNTEEWNKLLPQQFTKNWLLQKVKRPTAEIEADLTHLIHASPYFAVKLLNVRFIDLALNRPVENTILTQGLNSGSASVTLAADFNRCLYSTDGFILLADTLQNASVDDCFAFIKQHLLVVKNQHSYKKLINEFVRKPELYNLLLQLTNQQLTEIKPFLCDFVDAVSMIPDSIKKQKLFNHSFINLVLPHVVEAQQLKLLQSYTVESLLDYDCLLAIASAELNPLLLAAIKKSVGGDNNFNDRAIVALAEKLDFLNEVTGTRSEMKRHDPAVNVVPNDQAFQLLKAFFLEKNIQKNILLLPDEVLKPILAVLIKIKSFQFQPEVLAKKKLLQFNMFSKLSEKERHRIDRVIINEFDTIAPVLPFEEEDVGNSLEAKLINGESRKARLDLLRGVGLTQSLIVKMSKAIQQQLPKDKFIAFAVNNFQWQVGHDLDTLDHLLVNVVLGSEVQIVESLFKLIDSLQIDRPEDVNKSLKLKSLLTACFLRVENDLLVPKNLETIWEDICNLALQHLGETLLRLDVNDRKRILVSLEEKAYQIYNRFPILGSDYQNEQVILEKVLNAENRSDLTRTLTSLFKNEALQIDIARRLQELFLNQPDVFVKVLTKLFVGDHENLDSLDKMLINVFIPESVNEVPECFEFLHKVYQQHQQDDACAVKLRNFFSICHQTALARKNMNMEMKALGNSNDAWAVLEKRYHDMYMLVDPNTVKLRKEYNDKHKEGPSVEEWVKSLNEEDKPTAAQPKETKVEVYLGKAYAPSQDYESEQENQAPSQTYESPAVSPRNAPSQAYQSDEDEAKAQVESKRATTGQLAKKPINHRDSMMVLTSPAQRNSLLEVANLASQIPLQPEPSASTLRTVKALVNSQVKSPIRKSPLAKSQEYKSPGQHSSTSTLSPPHGAANSPSTFPLATALRTSRVNVRKKSSAVGVGSQSYASPGSVRGSASDNITELAQEVGRLTEHLSPKI